MTNQNNKPATNHIGRRTFLKSVAALSAVLALPQSLLARAQAKLAGSVNYWHHFTSPSEFEGLEQIIALFNKKYPDIKVLQENIPNTDYMAKFTAAVAADVRPDTAMIQADRFPDMVNMSGLVDLTDRVNQWELKKHFPDNRWEGVTRDGKIYGVPAYTFVDWMYYRTDYFEEAGISKPPTTLAEFLDAAKKLTDPSKNRYGFGLRGGDGGQAFIIDMIESFGSPIVVDGKAAIDKQKAIEAITFWSELYTKHKVVPPSAPNDSFRQIMEAFKTGQTAMVWHHTGSLVEIQQALNDMKGEKFMTAVRPAGPAALVTRTSVLYNGLMKTDNVDAAWEWVSYWGNTEPALAFLEKTGYFPASEAVTSDKKITENAYYQAALDSLKVARLPPLFVGYAGWAQKIALPAFQSVLTGSMSVEDCVDTIIAGLEKTVA
jgi:multiple sugar transport system substrate-binding protein